MAKVKRRAKKENTVQNKDNKVIKKCVVKLRRLNNKGIRKIDKTPLNKTQEESTSALDEQSTNSDDIFLAEYARNKSRKLKNCVVRMENLPGTGISLRTEEVLKPPQVENLSINPEPASKSSLEMIPEENFKTPVKKSRKVQLDISVKNTKTSQKNEKETNENDVYEFPSQSSTSEKEDPTADVVQELKKTGKVSVAKYLKGKGRLKTSRKRAAPKITTRNIKKNKIDEIPQENPVKPRDKELPKQTKIDVDTSPPIAHPVEKLEINESNKSQQRTPVTDKRKLLEFARNFVKQSTPIQKQNIGPTGSPYSPIAMKSPWRPLEEENLPRTFYFSRNEDDLPSFSSDFIPSSQAAERSRKSILNHSDIENVNPDNEAVVNNNNSNIRKTLGPRSPLKSINILEITNLPRKPVSDKSLIKPLLCNKLLPTSKSPLKLRDETEQSHNIDPENFSISNCFGFDECTEDQDEETTPKIVPDKSRLIARLKNLHRLCPKTTPRRPQEKVRTIYPKAPKQKDIRDVLSSTFQENESSTSNSIKNFNNSADISVIPEEGNQINSSHLFEDNDDPMTSAEPPSIMRTYIRYPKKRRHSLYHSDEEEEEEVEEKKSKKPKPTKATEAKRDELEKFVEEFNSMCEEVNQYELLIVKE